MPDICQPNSLSEAEMNVFEKFAHGLFSIKNDLPYSFKWDCFSYSGKDLVEPLDNAVGCDTSYGALYEVKHFSYKILLLFLSLLLHFLCQQKIAEWP